jgi:hypothetical protein
LRPTGLRRREDAAIDVPLKLLVSVVLMAMAAAILLPALQAYQRSEIEHRIELTVTDISSAALAVYHHPGSSRTVVVDVPSAGGYQLESLTIGGDLGASPSGTAVITWRHSGGTEGSRAVTTPNGHVPLCGPDGRALEVEGPRVVLVLEARQADTGPWTGRYVEVRAI